MVIFPFILCFFASLTGVHANSNEAQASVVRVTRLSTTAASVEFTYFHQPGLSLVVETNENSPTTFPIRDDILSEAQVFYDYQFAGLTASQSVYCFRVRVSGRGPSVPMNDSFCCSNTVTQRNNDVSQFKWLLNSYNPAEVSFQWRHFNLTEFKTILYCVDERSSFITHKQFNIASTTEVTLSQFKSATQYTCYISEGDETGIGNSSSVTFTTIPYPPYNLTGTLIGSDSLTVSWQYDYPPGHNFTVQAIVGCSESSQDSTLNRTSVQAIIALTELSPYTLYCITVSSEVRGATSAPSTTLMVRTLGIAPGPVRHLMATPTSNTTVLVRWSEPAMRNSDITGYLVEVINCPLCVGCSKSVGGNVTFFTCTGLDPCSEYTFRVAAVTREGQGVWTTESTRTLDQVPATPRLVNSDGIRSSQLIRWTVDTPSACVSGGVVTFDPVYSLDEQFLSNQSHSGTQSISIPSILKATETYNIRISLYGPGGVSEPSPWSRSTPVLRDPVSAGKTNYIQLLFTGLDACSSESFQQVADSLVIRLSYICPDTSYSIVRNRPICGVESSSVLFRAEVSGSDDFFKCLELWNRSTSPLLRVSGRVLLVDRACSQLYISSFDDNSCTTTAVEPDSSSGAVPGSLIGGMVLGALIAALVTTIIILVCFRRKLLQKNTKKIGVGSCTVLDTVGTTKYTQKKSKPKSSQPKTQASVKSEEDNYEMLPYQGDGSENVSAKQNVPSSHTPAQAMSQSVDSEYELPEIFIADQQKALSAAAPKKPEYEIPEEVVKLPSKPSNQRHPPVSKKPSLYDDTIATTQNSRQGAEANTSKAKSSIPPLPTTTKASTLPSSSSQAESGSNKKMPLIPKAGKKGDEKKMLSFPKDDKKKKPVLPIVGRGADKKSDVVSKAQMLESVYTGAPAPKTKPKPKDKDTKTIELSGNRAYEKWKMNKQ